MAQDKLNTVDKAGDKANIKAEKIGAVGDEVNIANQDISNTHHGDVNINIVYNKDDNEELDRAKQLAQDIAGGPRNSVQQVELQPLVSLLSRILDRKDQFTMLDGFSTSAICRCYVMECTDGDAPELFAHKIKALAHMRLKGLKSLANDTIEPINVAYSPGSRSFIDVLEDELEENVSDWIKKDHQLKVVFVSSSNGRNVAQQIASILSGINTLNNELSEQKNIAPCIIMVPFYREQFTWFAAKIAQLQISNMHKEGAIQLPKLGELSSYDLSAFVPELPKKARINFEEKFDTNDLNQEFYKCMKENEAKKYRDIKPDFEQILQKRIKP